MPGARPGGSISLSETRLSVWLPALKLHIRRAAGANACQTFNSSPSPSRTPPTTPPLPPNVTAKLLALAPGAQGRTSARAHAAIPTDSRLSLLEGEISGDFWYALVNFSSNFLYLAI